LKKGSLQLIRVFFVIARMVTQYGIHYLRTDKFRWDKEIKMETRVLALGVESRKMTTFGLI